MTVISAVDKIGTEQIHLVVDCERRVGHLTTVVGKSNLTLDTAIGLAHVMLADDIGLDVTEIQYDS